MSAIDQRQKILIHEYQRLAGLTRGEYCELLASRCGVRSSVDLDQAGFERAMAALEAALWYRVQEGIVPDPRGLPKHRAMRPDYWRSRATGKGMANSRLRWRIEQLWAGLSEYLPEEDVNAHYLAGIIAHAAAVQASELLDGDDIAWHRVPAHAANLAIEALKDRLKYAVRALHSSELPF